jgi:hypothetical protein
MHELVWIASSRGHDQAMVNGHLFRAIRHMPNGKAYWRCVAENCGVTVVTKNRQLVRVRGNHLHPKDETERMRRLFMNQCKTIIRDNPTTSIPQVVRQQNAIFLGSQTVSIDSIAQLPPAFTSIKSTLYQTKREVIPPESVCAADLQLSGSWLQTID